jgi:hypothetical protein
MKMLQMKHHSRIVFFLLALTVITRFCFSQAIVNTEKISGGEKEKFHLGIEFSIKGQRGNTTVFELDENFSVGYRLRNNWFRLIGGNKLLSQKDLDLINYAFIQIRYNYIFSKRVRTFHFFQLQSNKAILLRRRRLAGSGLRFSIFRSDSFIFDIGTGLMYEEEFLNEEFLQITEPSVTKLVRLTNILVLKYQLNERLTLVNINYFQPSLKQLSDFRILDEFNFLVEVAKNFEIDLALKWRLDNDPPVFLKKNDLNFKIGLIIKM